MMSTPAHKQTDPVKKPGQWVNPDVTKLDKLDPLSEFAKARQGTNHDMVDDMGSIGDDAIKAAEYKPTHGGYPSPSTPEERQALKLVVR